MNINVNIARPSPQRMVAASSTHQFRVGQAVRLKHLLWGGANLYRITATLPPAGDSPQYRIQCDGEKFERVARQDNLELAGVALG